MLQKVLQLGRKGDIMIAWSGVPMIKQAPIKILVKGGKNG